jgi:hypothetical protein
MKIKLLIALALLSLNLQARDVVDDTGICQINWSKGNITCSGESAEGQSSFAAKISAKVLAQRNLLEMVKGIQIDSQTKVIDGMLSSEIISSRVSGVIRGAQIISNRYNTSLKNAVATVRLQMGKDLLSALLSDPTKLSWNEKVERLWNSFNIIATANASTYTNQDKETIKKILADLRKNGDKKSTKYLETVLQNINDVKYSGIIIDVSNVVDFQKAIVVKLVDKQGKEVYPSDLVNRETLLKRNTSVGFIYGLEDARKNKRVFSKPLEFKVQQVYKNRKSNIVLSDEQIESIKSLDQNIVHHAKIMLVLGE